MNAWGMVLLGAALLAIFGAGFLLVLRNVLIAAIPLTVGGAFFCLVPIFFSKSVAPLHAAFDEFLGQPHRAAPFEDVRSVTEAWERIKTVAGSWSGSLVSAEPPAHPREMLVRLDFTQAVGGLFFGFVFLTLFSFYRLFRLIMAYVGCGLPWGRRARVEVGGMEYPFHLRYPEVIAGGIAYDLSESTRDPDDPYVYYLPSGTILRFFKRARKGA